MFEVDIIKALQLGSNPFADALNRFFTLFGEETLFIVVAVLLYWFYDKKFAFKFINVYLLSASVVEGYKASFKRLRPFAAYPNEIMSIGPKTSGYSFPSGHSHSIANMSTQLSLHFGKRKDGSRRMWVYITAALITVLVMFSRMYLGQHYLSDVITGMLCGVAHAVIFSFIFTLFKDKEEYFVFIAVPLAVLITVLIGCTNIFDNSEIAVGIGAFGAFSLGYFIEKRFVKYDIRKEKKPWKLVVRLVLGLGVALAIKELFKLCLPEDVVLLYDTLRYFVVALWAVLIAPLVFKLLKI